jgi:hypothetical protein
VLFELSSPQQWRNDESLWLYASAATMEAMTAIIKNAKGHAGMYHVYTGMHKVLKRTRPQQNISGLLPGL